MNVQLNGLVMASGEIAYQIRCDPDWLNRVDRAAKAIGLKKAAYIRMVVTQRMDADGVKKDDPGEKARKQK